jgi:D-alanyl-D-alanine carboxypeptidase
VKGFSRWWRSAGAGATKLATAAAVATALMSGAASAGKNASIVVDAETGRVIEEHNADALNYPASLTKMMTLYLTFEAVETGRLRLDQKLPVSARAANRAPSKLGLDPGDSITVREAILALVTKSANDAASVIAEALGGGSESTFAEKMTLKARKLGMSNTVFRNASGLPDPAQHTTARDLSTLALALYRDFPDEYRYFGTREFHFRGAVHANHNHLMKAFEGMDGIKTGFTNASGFNLAASAVRDNRRLVAVVMGGESARSRDRHMAELLNSAFANRLGRPAPTMVASTAALDDEDEPGGTTVAGRAAKVVSALSPIRRAEAAPVAAAAAPRRAVSDTRRWAIQLGAFSKQAAAEKAVATAAAKVPHGRSKGAQILKPAKTDKEHAFRARLVNFGEKEARDACRLLRKKHLQCAIIPPSAAVQLASATR